MIGPIASAGSRLAGAGELVLAPLAAVSPSNGQSHALEATGHRPWPLPRRPWLMAQSWEDLLFAHWRVPVAALRAVVPAAIPIDTYDGSAWLGVTPFRVSAARPRGLPHLSGLTAFDETNVRTYATVDGRPGIYFLSLDAASQLAVCGARRAYRLPYFLATASVERAGEWVQYDIERVSGDGPPAALSARYAATGAPFQASPGSLEWFLTERYCLYALDADGDVLRADIHHRPWPLTPARAVLARNTMAEPFGIRLAGEPLLHLARRQDVLIWSLQPA